MYAKDSLITKRRLANDERLVDIMGKITAVVHATGKKNDTLSTQSLCFLSASYSRHVLPKS